MNKTTQQFLEILKELNNNEELRDNLFNEIFEKEEKRRKEALLFGGTKEYELVLQNLHDHLDGGNYAYLDEYNENVAPNITNESFLALHDYAFCIEEEVKLVRDVFPVDYVFHKGICFKKMYGQGTMYSACKYPDDIYVLSEKTHNN